MYDDKWNTFMATGKISDYLNFKGISYESTVNNGDINADTNTNTDTQGVNYT